MHRGTLEEVVRLADQVGYAFVVTASANGLRHVAAARGLTSVGEGRVVVAEWLCPGTMENLQ